MIWLLLWDLVVLEVRKNKFFSFSVNIYYPINKSDELVCQPMAADFRLLVTDTNVYFILFIADVRIRF
jgi:hypothetical protein